MINSGNNRSFWKKAPCIRICFFFNAAKSNFDTIEALHVLIEDSVNPNNEMVNPDEVNVILKKRIIKPGAKDVGFTLLKDYH